MKGCGHPAGLLPIKDALNDFGSGARSVIKGLLCLAVTAYLAAFFYTERFPEVRVLVDTQEYLNSGQNLIRHGVLYAGDLDRPIEPHLYSRRPPVYSVLVAGLDLVADDLTAVAVLQMLLSFLSAILIIDLTRTLRFAVSTSIILAVAFLVYPTQIIYSQMVMAEVLLQVFVLGYLVALMRFAFGARVGWLFMANACLALAILTKPVMLYFWIPNLLVAGFLFKRGGIRTLICSLLPLVAILTWSYRNEIHTGDFRFSSMQSTQIQLMLPGVDAESESEEIARSNTSLEREYYRELIRNWPNTLRRLGRSTAFLLLDPGRFDIYEFLDWPHEVRSVQLLDGQGLGLLERFGRIPGPVWIYLFAVGLFNLATLLGLVYFIGQQLRFWPPRPESFLLVVILYTALIIGLGAIGTSRYRIAIEPVLLVCCAPLVERFRRAGKLDLVDAPAERTF